MSLYAILESSQYIICCGQRPALSQLVEPERQANGGNKLNIAEPAAPILRKFSGRYLQVDVFKASTSASNLHHKVCVALDPTALAWRAPPQECNYDWSACLLCINSFFEYQHEANQGAADERNVYHFMSLLR